MKLTEQSVISLGLAGMIVGLAYWTGSVVSTHATRLDVHDAKLKSMEENFQEDRRETGAKLDRLSQDMARVTARLDLLLGLEEKRASRP